MRQGCAPGICAAAFWVCPLMSCRLLHIFLRQNNPCENGKPLETINICYNMYPSMEKAWQFTAWGGIPCQKPRSRLFVYDTNADAEKLSRAPSYLNSRLLGCVTIGYIEPTSHYLGNSSLGTPISEIPSIPVNSPADSLRAPFTKS